MKDMGEGMKADDDDLTDRAGLVFLRLTDATLPEDERAELTAWAAAAPQHEAALEAVRRAWRAAGDAVGDPAVAALLADMRGRYAGERPVPVYRRFARYYVAGAAVAAALALFALLPASLRPFGPASDPSLLAAGRGAGATTAWQSVVAAKGQRRTVRLPDGSHMVLDAGSSARYAFADGRRAIRLDGGRAFFAVHKDKAHPFVVQAGRLTATAVGTAFDVERLGAAEQVTTTEGVVRVETRLVARNGSHSTLLPAGQRLTQRAAAVTVSPVDLSHADAWQSGRLVVESECLGDIALQMNRYGATPLIVSGDAASLAISGVFEADNAEGFVDALRQQGLVRVVRGRNGLTLLPGSVRSTVRCRTTG